MKGLGRLLAPKDRQTDRQTVKVALGRHTIIAANTSRDVHAVGFDLSQPL